MIHMSYLRKLMAVAGTALAVGATPALAQDKIRMGVLPFSESLGAVMADRLGYFKEVGIEVEMQRVVSGAHAVPLLQAGRLDVAFSNTVSTLQAIEQGFDAIILASGGQVRTTAPDATSALFVLKDGDIRTPADLAGKRVAINVVNSIAWLYTAAWLDKNGVDPKKVRFVEVPFPQMNDPLLNKQVDMITQVEPFSTVMLGTGRVAVLGYSFVEVQPGGEITQYIALNSWVQANRDLAQRFSRAIQRGSAYVNDPANEAAVRQANREFTNLNPDLQDKVRIPLLGTQVKLDEIRKTHDLMRRYGLLKTEVKLDGRVLGAR